MLGRNALNSVKLKALSPSTLNLQIVYQDLQWGLILGSLAGFEEHFLSKGYGRPWAPYPQPAPPISMHIDLNIKGSCAPRNVQMGSLLPSLLLGALGCASMCFKLTIRRSSYTLSHILQHVLPRFSTGCGIIPVKRSLSGFSWASRG